MEGGDLTISWYRTFLQQTIDVLGSQDDHKALQLDLIFALCAPNARAFKTRRFRPEALHDPASQRAFATERHYRQ